MKLVPVYAGDQLPNHTAAGAVEVSPEKQQLIGVEYGTAEYETTANTIHAAARVTLDENQIVKVQTRLEGLDRPRVRRFHRQVCEKGDALATVYSPDALATQQEYLLALSASIPCVTEPCGASWAVDRRQRIALLHILAGEIGEHAADPALQARRTFTILVFIQRHARRGMNRIGGGFVFRRAVLDADQLLLFGRHLDRAGRRCGSATDRLPYTGTSFMPQSGAIPGLSDLLPGMHRSTQ